MTTKHCRKCEQDKPYSEFYKDRSRSDGISWTCKACQNSYSARWKERKPDAYRARQVKYNNSRPAYGMLIGARYRAKKFGVPFNLVEDDIAIPKVCPVLGIPLRLRFDERREDRDDSPSLDRLVPELGYVKGNVNVMSNKANRMKNNGSIEELEMVIAWFRKQQAS